MISVLIVCRYIDKYLMRAIESVEDLNPQILIDLSSNGEALGVRKNRLINLASYEWVLVIDTDEVVSKRLCAEIRDIINGFSVPNVNGYKIPYQNYIFGHPVYYGGEKYSRIQFFRKRFGLFTPASVHEHPIVKGKIGKFSGVIHHYSYVAFLSIIAKFTKYSWQIAESKNMAHEWVTLKKLFLYGPHMFWARAIKDKGWRDGWRGILLAACFAYMETLIYWLLLWRNIFHR